ncbi:RepB family protein [Lentilactobacillus parakefiri]|uniref:RepB family protein n=1 Tax=Lentilactobacillus parakefiri TaxID=152332 RepID=UPI000BA6401A|nr:RepB family protein [Lentilactobacillus parakefiri]PAK99541.1 RepB family protein [Lentilactobacillus parakefiri]
METISSIAKKLQVTNGRVYQIIRELPKDKQPKKNEQGKYNFNEINIKAIVDHYNRTGMKQNDNLNNDNEIIKQLRVDLEQARTELQTKNQQIAKFQKLLDQQQQLNLSSQKLLENQKSEQNIKNDATQSPEGRFKSDKSNSDTNTNEQSKKPSKEKQESFWKRLFR